MNMSKWAWLMLLLPLGVQADRESMQEWLHAVTPKLTMMAAQHPRIKGQSVGIVGLQDGAIVTIDDGLGRDLKSHFENALLQQGNVRVPLREHEKAEVLLGIEIGQLTSGHTSIVVAYLDPVEGIWINRSRETWQGRLSIRERQLQAGSANQVPVSTGHGGSAVSLLHADHGRKLCKKRNCMDVSYEVFSPAYVFEFYTRGDRVAALSCNLTKKRTGLVEYGLNIPDGQAAPGRPDLGFYVLATHDLQTARQLRRLLASGQSCGKSPVTRSQSWRDELARLVGDGAVTWRAAYFENQQGGVNVL